MSTPDNTPRESELTFKERLAFEEREFRHLCEAARSDILFILLPFLAIMFQRFWSGEIYRLLVGPEIAIACTVLGGLSISKFAQSLTTAKDVGAHKERITMAIAVALFVILTPASMLTLKLSSGDAPPLAVAFLQPILLAASIALYVTVIRLTTAGMTTLLPVAAPAHQDKTPPPPALAPYELDAFGAEEVGQGEAQPTP